MDKKKPVNYADQTDKDLIEKVREDGSRKAVIALYERYRDAMGRFLYQEISDPEAVTTIFNSALFELIKNVRLSPEEVSVSKRLLAMLYTRRLEYRSTERDSRKESNIKQILNAKGRKHLTALSELHHHVAELAYQHNCTIPEITDIIGCTPTVVRDCLSNLSLQPHKPSLPRMRRKIKSPKIRQSFPKAMSL